MLFPEKYLNLENGKIRAEYNHGSMILESDTYVSSVELSIPEVSGAVFSDNYFDLIPGEPKTVSIIEQKMGKQIKIKGLNCDDVIILLD